MPRSRRQGHHRGDTNRSCPASSRIGAAGGREMLDKNAAASTAAGTLCVRPDGGVMQSLRTFQWVGFTSAHRTVLCLQALTCTSVREGGVPRFAFVGESARVAAAVVLAR